MSTNVTVKDSKASAERSAAAEKEKRHVVSLDSEVHKRLSSLVGQSNQKKYGKKISPADIVSYSITLVKESEIQKIQEQSLTVKDKIEIEVERYNQKNESNLTTDEFLAMKLKLH
jgi:hypothetical protein